MKYEFHVGDYVETWDGKIGYLTTFIHSHDYGEITIFVNYKDGKTQGYKFRKDELYHYFKRIGAYDFTKKEKKKIEQIFRDGINEDMSLGGSLCMFKNKINELVDAVNLLLDKSTES